MKLVSFGDIGNERPGLLINDDKKIIDLQKADSSFPSDILTFIKLDLFEKAKQLLLNAQNIKDEAIFCAEDFRIGAPVYNSRLIVGVGLNYMDHADEQGTKYPKQPLLFCKSPGAICGASDDVIYPSNVEQLDYEVELAVVIKKTCRKVRAGDAFDYIAGYSTFHDVSARCAQFGDRQWFRAKSFDTFAPFGPALVTPDEIADPNNLDLWCKVNEDLRQDSNTSKMIHPVDKLIEYISQSLTLEAGDIIATGTPAGVGCFMDPPKLLKKGDVVEMEVKGLGKIRNCII